MVKKWRLDTEDIMVRVEEEDTGEDMQEDREDIVHIVTGIRIDQEGGGHYQSINPR